MANQQILIAGAGPTGLVLALSLSLRGVPVRIIDRKKGPADQSRAVAIQARTLELYKQLGIADAVIDRGIPAERGRLFAESDGESRKLLQFNFKDIGEGLSPYPYLLFFAQDDHERLLLSELSRHGVQVEWQTSLVGLQQQDGRVLVKLSREGSTPAEETVEMRYVCGCDGGHSRVRESLQIGFPGGSYDQLFYVADVMTSMGTNRDMVISLGENTLALLFPVRKDGSQRIVGLVPRESGGEEVTFEDVRGGAEAMLDVKVTNVRWFSTYHVHHRVAEHFRRGDAFLLGDAGHVHSPAGGQGMNTGIGDAINLAWKLAEVVQGNADAALLDSYEPERIAFARALVSTTDKAFTGMVADGVKGELMRRIAAPLFFGVATQAEFGRRLFFQRLSQIALEYRDSDLSEGVQGGVHGGDRLPWVAGEAGGPDNFAPLQSRAWQAHVYGSPSGEMTAACERQGLPLHVLPWNERARSAELKRDSLYLVRPDGYVALAAAPHEAVRLLQVYAERFGLRFGLHLDSPARQTGEPQPDQPSLTSQG